MRPSRRRAVPQSPRAQRCAIYTRKSTDHNLDLAFNSLDAQREACEAYVRSQAHEGWSLVQDRFDDGAFSGASLERPALQALLDLVRARRVDVIVVYKVDRLTRSLADFAKLVELFDAHEVSFVSVTQSLNTTSSMGRLTLNVLLSFAQFEREVIGERVRDKISASKRKGIWVGGPIPLGYRSVNKRLEIVPEDAETVRGLFADCLRLGSVGAVVADRNAAGIRPKPRALTNGRIVQARCYRVGPLAHLLKNRFYIGEVVYRGEVHPGDHPPIIAWEAFEKVQALLAQNATKRRLTRSSTPALLTGRLFDDRGNRMSPGHAVKSGARYRYYVSQAILQRHKDSAGSVSRVSAPDIEAAVLTTLQQRFPSDEMMPDAELIEHRVERVIVCINEIEVHLRTSKDADLFNGDATDSNDAVSELSDHNSRVQGASIIGDARCPSNGDAGDVLTIPFQARRTPARHMLEPTPSAATISAEARDTLLKAIARARRWAEQIQSDPAITTDVIATAEAMAERHVSFLLPLAFLSPAIVTAIVDGAAPASLSVTGLAKALPHRWADQERMHLGQTATSVA